MSSRWSSPRTLAVVALALALIVPATVAGAAPGERGPVGRHRPQVQLGVLVAQDSATAWVSLQENNALRRHPPPPRALRRLPEQP